MTRETPTPPSTGQKDSRPQAGEKDAAGRTSKDLDRELDQELDDTFPASDPLPWSHEVK